MGYEIHVTDKGMEALYDYVLDIVAEEILSKAQDNLIEFKKVDTGYLQGSAYNERISATRRKIGFSAPYSSSIEFGSLPHYVPYKTLISWVRRKLGVQEKDAKRIAYFISRKIAYEGTKPYPYVRNAIQAVKNKYR